MSPPTASRSPAQLATGVDAQARSVTLADGTRLPYDRLVLAPGIDIRWGALPGYDEAAAAQMPHAWKAGEQTLLLRRQLEAMQDGGLVVISAPANPFRCPPGPYERASLIAHYLKTKKPQSKLIVLDAKDTFSKQRLFQAAWAELYPGLLEWVPLSKGGNVTSVDAATRTLVTDFGRHKAEVANVIPPQKAGRIAEVAGRRRPHRLVPDRSGRRSSRSCSPASTSSATPRSPAPCRSRPSPRTRRPRRARRRSRCCSRAAAPPTPKLINTCYSLVAPDYGISVAGVYAPSNGQLADVPGAGGVSPRDAPRASRAAEAVLRRGLVPHDHRRGLRVRLAAAVVRRRVWLRWSGAGRSGRSDAIPHVAHRRRRAIPVAARAIVTNRQVGLCLLCHSGPFPGGAVPGQSRARSARARAPRWSEGQLRLRIVDSGRINPTTIMPAYHRTEGLDAGGAGLARQAGPER